MGEAVITLPGHINAHDHLDFGTFPRIGPRTGRGPYANAAEWARDIYRPDEEPVASCLRVPKRERILAGAWRNVRAGVTTVMHHNPPEGLPADLPLRTVERYGWAHSLTFEHDVRARFEAAPPDAPFFIHAAEGTNEAAAREVFALDELGVLCERTVLIHCTGVTSDGWDLIRKRRCSVIWCPRSNLFTLGRTQPPPLDIPAALGTDSPLTNDGTFLDELCTARRLCPEFRHDPHRVLRIEPQPDDWIVCEAADQPPKIVVIGGKVVYRDSTL